MFLIGHCQYRPDKDVARVAPESLKFPDFKSFPKPARDLLGVFVDFPSLNH